jgi:thiosulfate/3-mercaptopyruvate sulfurtransferase
MAVTANSTNAEIGSLVSPAWLEAHLGDPNLRLIEIAGLFQDDMAAYRAGHVPGAVCWKWKEMLWDARMRDFPSPDEFARRMGAAGIGNDTNVVVYGEDVQFGVYAWWTLRYCGHRNVRLLDGARYRWKAEGRPLTTDIPPAPAAAEYLPVTRNPAMRIFRDEVAAALGNEDIVVLDARSPEEYRGERVGGPGGPDVGAVRAGRIPGARHLHFIELLDDNKSFKPAAEIKAILAERGFSPDKQAIAYCRLSHRATVLYFAVTEILGLRNMRVYDGSWIEWGNLVGAPIER